MGIHAVVAAAIPALRQQQPHDHWPPPRPESESQRIHDDSYGTMSTLLSSASSPLARSPVSPGDDELYVEEDEQEEYEDHPVIDVTWKYMSRIYLLVPLFALLVVVGMVLLVTYAWPPSRGERQRGQRYPHPILPWPFLTGLFAAVTVQSLRVPVYIVVSWLPISPRAVTFLSTTIHSILHELLRLATLPMIRPSPTSGFHSSYYLGLGWGVAEVTWGIAQGWEQLALYEDVMRRVKGLGLETSGEADQLVSHVTVRTDDLEEMDEAELERRVEILERMRARRDLEQVLGVPYPNIPFPFHLLWRLDTLLLNLGLTLIMSTYYFNSYPIYRHAPVQALASAPRPGRNPSPYLWLAWAFVTVLHVGLSLMWKIVGRLGLGAVTWGGLIVSLGSVFAGLGGWGGLL